MSDLDFDVELMWSGVGREGAVDSGPESSSAKPSARISPSAVSSCYTATLFSVPRRAQPALAAGEGPLAWRAA